MTPRERARPRVSTLTHLRFVRAACALVLAGCGARTALEAHRDAGASVDAGRIDAGARDAGTADAGPPGACTLGPHTRLAGDAPGFAFSLLPAGDSFVLGMSLGWPPDERARIALVDGSLAAITRDVIPVPLGERVFAGTDVATLQANGVVSLITWDSIEGGSSTRELSRDSFVDSPPVRGPGVLAVPLARPEGTLMFVPDGPGPIIIQGPFGGATSAVVGNEDDVWLVFGGAEGARMHRFSWEGVLLTDTPIVLSEEPTLALDATSSGEARAIVAVRTESGRIDVLDVGREGMVRSRTIADARPFAYDLEVSIAERTIAVVWSELAGSGQGVHVAVLERPLGAVLLAPTQVVADSGSYTVTSTIAPHLLGHAIAWGGWQPGTNYGVYTTLLTCP